jgi:DNA helicase-2/ATP-dependent DNA helicase PcrA
MDLRDTSPERASSTGLENHTSPQPGRGPLGEPRPSVQGLLEDLNPPQREAVEHRGGPLLVLAGAGSGKTRVVTYRMAHLLATGEVRPWNILAVTFTNKAAREMRERVWGLLGRKEPDLWVSTFHATCARILRGHAHLVGYPREFSILDQADQLALAKDCCKELNLDPERFPAGMLLQHVSDAKQAFVSCPQYRARWNGDYLREKVGRLYELYQDRLRRAGAMDFDDLLFWVLTLFLEHPQVLEFYRRRWTHVLVDEFQDTNQIQYRIVKALAQEHRQICVVGDDDQSIYSWRGADPTNILEFDRDFPDVRVVQNYRSTSHIIQAASSLIRQNRMRRGKDLWTANEPGDRVAVYVARDEREEAGFVAREIRHLVAREGFRPADFAVFYRTHAQSRALEEELLDCGVPFAIYGAVGFYERKEVKDVLAYLRALVYPSDDLSWKRILNVPRRGIGPKTLRAAETLAAGEGVPLSQALELAAGAAPKAGCARLREFLQLMDRLKNRLQEEGVASALKGILQETGYLSELRRSPDPLAGQREENLEELLNIAVEYEAEQGANPLGFLERVALFTDLDLSSHREDRVSLMTLHSAKGLEFPVVFLVGMEEGLLPHRSSLEDPAALEEERRLCYVGMTRARKRLYLCLAATRRVWGTPKSLPASRFLWELPADHLESLSLELGVSPGWQEHSGDRPNAVVGRWVRHSAFGVGTLLRVEAGGERLVVHFPGIGERRFITREAPLEWL